MHRSYTQVFAFISFLFGSILHGQNSIVPLTKKDSLLAFSKSEPLDTSRLIHLNDLAWEMMYENLDTAVIIGNQALKEGYILLQKSSELEDPSVKTSVIRSIAKTNNNLGVCYEFMGNYKTSLWYHLKALKIRSILNDTLGMAKSFNNIGNVYDSQGNYLFALEYYFKALRSFIDLRNAYRAAGAYTNIGIVYQRLGEYSTSLEYLFKGLKIFEFLKKTDNVAQVLTNIGTAYQGQKNYPMSVEYYFKALKLDEASGNQYNMAILFTNIGLVYKVQGDNVHSLEYYQKALQLHEELGNSYGVSNNTGSIGSIYMDEKKYAEAETYLKKAMDISIEIGALDLIEVNYKFLSELYAQTNRYELAYKMQLAYTNAKDSLFNQEKSKEIGRLEAKHEITVAAAERERAIQSEIKYKTEKRKRKTLLQYSGMLIGLMMIALFVVVLGFKKVSPRTAGGVTFFAFLLLFEFLLILVDPYVENLSRGEAAYKLLVNVLLAALIFPLHAFFERLLKKKLIKK